MIATGSLLQYRKTAYISHGVAVQQLIMAEVPKRHFLLDMKHEVAIERAFHIVANGSSYGATSCPLPFVSVCQWDMTNVAYTVASHRVIVSLCRSCSSSCCDPT